MRPAVLVLNIPTRDCLPSLNLYFHFHNFALKYSKHARTVDFVATQCQCDVRVVRVLAHMRQPVGQRQHELGGGDGSCQEATREMDGVRRRQSVG